jgi:phosphoribosyl 1,2-cyclic phosphate phosphodiesterase
MTLMLTILGCASSAGVPRVGGTTHEERWGSCDPDNPKNHRRRCSILLTRSGPNGSTYCVIDTGPDFRAQMLDTNVPRLDGVVYTHQHADHLHGIDDMRPFALIQRQRIPVFMDAQTFERANTAFGYVFETPPGSGYPPILEHRRVRHDQPVTVDGVGGPIVLTPVPVEHGDITALGYRIADTLYLPDVSSVPETSLPLFDGLDTLIIDSLRRRPHPSHFNLDEALALSAQVKPRHTILTNLHNDLDYETVLAETPETVEPAYDGMALRVA